MKKKEFPIVNALYELANVICKDQPTLKDCELKFTCPLYAVNPSASETCVRAILAVSLDRHS